MFKGLPFFADHNEGGYRGPYPSKNKPSDEYRIFLLGGSTVYIGDPLLSTLLTEEFHKHGYTHVQVYNFGVISTVSSQELMTIVTTFFDLKPDLIIQYDGANDLYHPLYYDPRPGYPYDFMVYEMSPLLYPEKMSALKFLIYKNPFIRFIAERYFPNYYMNQFLPLASVRNDVGYASEKWKQSIIDSYISNIRKAQIISHSFGSEYISILQPMIYDKKYLTDEEKPLVMQTEIPYFHDMKDRIVETMSKDSYKDIHFVNLADYVDSIQETMFIDVMHIYQEKYPFITQIIYEAILQEVSIPIH